MNKIRTLLDEIKKLDDIRHQSEGDPPEDTMILYPPADPEDVKKLLKGGWSHPLPSSFANFLAASNGITKFMGRLNFLSTDAKQQEQIRSVVESRIEQNGINLRAMFTTVDDAVIGQWAAKPDNVYAAHHPVIAVTDMGGLLFYDTRTRDANGAMQLCWKPATSNRIKERFETIEQYFEMALQEAKDATVGG